MCCDSISWQTPCAYACFFFFLFQSCCHPWSSHCLLPECVAPVLCQHLFVCHFIPCYVSVSVIRFCVACFFKFKPCYKLCLAVLLMRLTFACLPCVLVMAMCLKLDYAKGEIYMLTEPHEAHGHFYSWSLITNIID